MKLPWVTIRKLYQEIILINIFALNDKVKGTFKLNVAKRTHPFLKNDPKIFVRIFVDTTPRLATPVFILTKIRQCKWKCLNGTVHFA